MIDSFESHCKSHGISFERHRSVISPDDTTLFSTSGMQKRKPQFSDPHLRGLTVGDSQTCLRTSDLDEIGDGVHGIVFEMLGLFSFRDWGLSQGCEFWVQWLGKLGLRPDRITLHPDRERQWRPMWETLGFGSQISLDPECKWSDGSIGGYCTELYIGGVEIGNIVNPLGDCLDCGFGLNRIGRILGLTEPQGERETLIECLEVMRQSGIRPGPKGRGYVMRRVLRRLIDLREPWDDPLWREESRRRERSRLNFERLLPRNPGKDPSWWMETHGIDPTELG